MKLIQEFREFAMRGNVIDLAVGVIIGAAFGKIVTSLVENLINPIIGRIAGRLDFTNLFLVIGPGKLPTLAEAHTQATTLELAKTLEVPVLKYGAFITDVINFLIVAFAIFMMIKAINALKRKQAADPEAPAAAPSPEVILLAEIRDAIRSKP